MNLMVSAIIKNMKKSKLFRFIFSLVLLLPINPSDARGPIDGTWGPIVIVGPINWPINLPDHQGSPHRPSGGKHGDNHQGGSSHHGSNGSHK